MSLVIQGNAGNVTTPLTASVVAITAATGGDAGQWRVQTAAPHLFGTGDYVQLVVTISAVTTTAYGNINVIDATHFDVAGTTFTATGTGVANDLSLTPAILVPTDGDEFSLQLSGMLSALQALADRTQALRSMMIARESTFATVTSTGSVPVPPWANAVLLDGCGGGGGGGGGMGGFSGAQDQLWAGGGGAGARRTTGIYLLFGATAISVNIGAGGTAGAGQAGGASPVNAGPGGDGGSSYTTYVGGSDSGVVFATFTGGAAGGGGNRTTGGAITSSSTPGFTPGGRGPAGLFRGGPTSQSAPGYQQVINLVNTSGTITSGTTTWPLSTYVDPVGQMQYCEGGASMSNGGNATYATALSYAGAPSPDGLRGGAAGTNGTNGSLYPGGSAGGGGGGGGFGAGGAGGNGGNGSDAGNGTAGTVGSVGTLGGGGGGGGGGGSGATGGGAGKNGGVGGSGQVNLIFLAFPTTP